MISLILPYWDRQEAADNALRILAETYKGLDLEVIIVDDGSGFIKPDISLNISIVTLPKKNEPKCPCTAWNEGVKASTGEQIVLSCIEIIHAVPVLEEMRQELIKLGEDGYILAAAWCPDFAEWHCHTSVKVPTCPEGTGIAFCGMMNRELFFRAGGFDENYREGAGYEDRDFINRLYSVGAKFKICDDLVVTHPKSGATIEWGSEKFARNEAFYLARWPECPSEKFFHIVCVNWGNYCDRGKEYVNKLYDMVARNCPRVKWAFVCLTDDIEGYDVGINPLPLRHGLKGWDNKISLFEKNLFPDGDRVIFFDLDTLILNDLEDLFKYDGELATLRDFWRPEGLGPAVICWEAGKCSWIWDKYVEEGFPTLERGDQEWMERICTPDILQDLYPDKFFSYKTHCNPYPPQEAMVVCFHGHPRPHECSQKWVQDIWKVGGNSSLNLRLFPNTNNEKIFSNIKQNSDKATWICSTPAHEGHAIIVGSGPSLLENIELIRNCKQNGGVIFSLNNAAKVLSDNGIISDYQVILDAREDNLEFVRERYTNCYLLASQVHPDVFEACNPKLLWHPAIEKIEELFPEHPMTLIGGGITVGLSSMSLVYAMGYRKLHLFGYDSSFREGQLHAIPQTRTNLEKQVFEVSVNEKTFLTNAAMAKQAELFPGMMRQLNELDVEIYIYGDGLLPHIAHILTT